MAQLSPAGLITSKLNSDSVTTTRLKDSVFDHSVPNISQSKYVPPSLGGVSDPHKASLQ